jgi:hypothetical protein
MPDFLGDRVHRQEPDPADVLRQAVRVLRDHSDRILAVGLEDAHGTGCRHAVPMQKDHNFPDDVFVSPSNGALFRPDLCL